MGKITIIEGEDLRTFLANVTGDNIYRVRIWPQGDGTIKVKTNEGIWTWTIGEADGEARA